MAELWPFIQSLVKKWQLEGIIFALDHFLFNFMFDGLFRL